LAVQNPCQEACQHITGCTSLNNLLVGKTSTVREAMQIPEPADVRYDWKTVSALTHTVKA